MARVEGPLMSVSASGTYAKALTFSNWKGRPYVRERVTPSNPKAAKQTGVRVMMGFLAAAWASIISGTKATWDDLAKSRSISSFNEFVSANLSRWQDSFTPSQAYPAAEASTGLTVTTQTLTGGVGMATVQITPSGSTSIWGLLIFRSTSTGFAPSWANCVGIIRTSDANAKTFVDSPLNPGTYYYRTAVFNTDGKLGTIHAESTGTVVT